jgi:hypothetical protein
MRQVVGALQSIKYKGRVVVLGRNQAMRILLDKSSTFPVFMDEWAAKVSIANQRGV